MSTNIPFGKPLIKKEEKNAVSKILNNPILVHGPKTPEFEALFSKFTNSKYSIAVSSCTAGLHLFYFTLGIKKGDEVIVSSQTHVATAHAIELVGATPIFIDSNTEDGNIDVKKIEEKITKKTRAICIVHYLGIPCDIEELLKIKKKYKLYLLEDCALALGSKYKKKHVGLFGDAGVFSFYPVKHITSAEGGMIITNNLNLSKKLKINRAFGVNKTHSKRSIPGMYDVESLGFNYRMSEIHAAIGCEQIKKIKSFLNIRKKNFNHLKRLFSKNDDIKVIDTYEVNKVNSHYCLMLLLPNQNQKNRSKLINELKKNQIGTSIYYPHPVPRLNYYKKKYKFDKNKFINSIMFSDQTICLPVGQHLKIVHMNKIYFNVIKAIKLIYG